MNFFTDSEATPSSDTHVCWVNDTTPPGKNLVRRDAYRPNMRLPLSCSPSSIARTSGLPPENSRSNILNIYNFMKKGN